MVGKRFGALVVIQRDRRVPSQSHSAWLCRCDCGNVATRYSATLRTSRRSACDACNARTYNGGGRKPGVNYDLTGRRFGRLCIVRRLAVATRTRSARWLCRCDCGRDVELSTNILCYEKKPRVACYDCVPRGRPGRECIDRTGTRIGSLTLLSRTGGKFWLCRCDCGREERRNIYTASNAVKIGRRATCSACIAARPKTRVDRIGQRVGRLTIVARGNHRSVWVAQCDCGRRTSGSWHAFTMKSKEPQCIRCHLKKLHESRRELPFGAMSRGRGHMPVSRRTAEVCASAVEKFSGRGAK